MSQQRRSPGEIALRRLARSRAVVKATSSSASAGPPAGTTP
jgi:hypothetical protein